MVIDKHGEGEECCRAAPLPEIWDTATFPTTCVPLSACKTHRACMRAREGLESRARSLCMLTAFRKKEIK